MLDATQLVQIIGAAAILIAFGLSQFKLASSDDAHYLLLNLVGGVLLLASATIEEQWGFIVLEAAWSLISGWSLLTILRRAPATS